MDEEPDVSEETAQLREAYANVGMTDKSVPRSFNIDCEEQEMPHEFNLGGTKISKVRWQMYKAQVGK